MAFPFLFRLPLVVLLLHAILLFSYSVRAADEIEQLRQNLNSYRALSKLPALKENNNADCIADLLSEQFKSQPCTNTTGIEIQLSKYPDILAHCYLNIANTIEGKIMPACVPNLVPTLVLSNYKETQYSGYLNDRTFTGAGVGSEGKWIFVVLTTDTPGGSYVPATSLAPKIGVICPLLTLFLSFFLVLVS